jgi:hypothetical protein
MAVCSWSWLQKRKRPEVGVSEPPVNNLLKSVKEGSSGGSRGSLRPLVNSARNLPPGCEEGESNPYVLVLILFLGSVQYDHDCLGPWMCIHDA